MSLIGCHIDAGFHRLIVDLIRFQRTTASRCMAQAIKDGILERADRGVDSNLQPFVPYAGLTMELKMHRGQRLDPPSLRDTGEMLDTIKYVPGYGLVPGNAETADRAAKHQWGGVGDMGRPIPQRRFFDAREEDVEEGERMIVLALSAGMPGGMDV